MRVSTVCFLPTLILGISTIDSHALLRNEGACGTSEIHTQRVDNMYVNAQMCTSTLTSVTQKQAPIEIWVRFSVIACDDDMLRPIAHANVVVHNTSALDYPTHDWRAPIQLCPSYGAS